MPRAFHVIIFRPHILQTVHNTTVLKLTSFTMASLSLEQRKQRAKTLFPPTHCLPPQVGEVFSTVEAGKTRLQDYAFTQGFALVQESFQKQRGILLLDCSRHHSKERNTRDQTEEERTRKSTNVAFADCKYRLRLKKSKEDTWRLVITNDVHNHPMAIDPFSFKEHHSRDPDRAQALDHASSLRNSSTTYGQATRVLRIRGLRLSKNDYYNLVRSEGSHSPEEELQFALSTLETEGFHVRCMEKYLVENDTRQRRVVEHFFFCNEEQIRLARRFVSGYLIETDATFNTNQLNLPLSTLVGVTNTMRTFTVAYCYITSESAESFLFLFECMRDLIFHDRCPGPGVILGDFAAGLVAAMTKKRSQTLDRDIALNVAWEVSQAMDSVEANCALQLCTWHAAEAIKKRLITAGGYPKEIRKELETLIWDWIKSSTIEQLVERRRKLLDRLHSNEQVSISDASNTKNILFFNF